MKTIKIAFVMALILQMTNYTFAYEITPENGVQEVEEVYVMTADEILWEDAYMNAEETIDPYVWDIWYELSDEQRDEITALIEFLANSYYAQNFYDN